VLRRREQQQSDQKQWSIRISNQHYLPSMIIKAGHLHPPRPQGFSVPVQQEARRVGGRSESRLSRSRCLGALGGLRQTKISTVSEIFIGNFRRELRTVVNASRMDCSSDITEKGCCPCSIILVTSNQTNSTLLISSLTCMAWMSFVTVVMI
jgi:hypothetical protein